MGQRCHDGRRLVLFFGRLSDRFGRRPIYMIACIAVGAYAFPVFALVNTGQPVLIVAAFAISIGVIWAAFAGIQGSWFSELFSINCRASGASIATRSRRRSAASRP